ncbi:3-phosphoshikimate 1-carboxyvinyltransferase [Kiritimatiella glycovorans]|uniref:3-phosphoshikimate 1-carboxyvinyltransferase n=1 Tax=Kiritimatiella glycovorans TaxID=1307763 RepID=A0A0G3ED77_9BACT|nr:3-phosphoshikimate 1-carboxyvinyltransferase [Kiritimatiella glycovorans]AKJ64278.1 3-phosphoshikimate 1-carboxyvinyltransferase [Kiritimatiella glycovorans]
MNRAIDAAGPLQGRLSAPGDKSISHRAALLAAVAEGVTTVEGYLFADDCCATLNAVSVLGARVRRDGDRLEIEGTGGALSEPDRELDLGNSGTGARLLAGLLAARPFETVVTGDASLRRRPMSRIRDPLERMGAAVELTPPGDTLPMRIRGGGLEAIEYALPVASAQVKSCVLLAGLFARGTTCVLEPRPCRDHTERLLAYLGADIRVDGDTIELEGPASGGPRLRARPIVVPGDISSAAFWLVAAAARPGAEVTIEGVGLNPRRSGILDVLRRMGAEIEITEREAEGEPLGDILVRGRTLNGTEVAGAEIPNVIDELPLIAAAGALAEGRTEIRDAEELRVKESDRISAMTAHLRAFGAQVDEREDGMSIAGGARLQTPDAPLPGYGDHRIAMASAVLAAACGIPAEIADVGCVDTSYPQFWEHFAALGGSTRGIEVNP